MNSSARNFYFRGKQIKPIATIIDYDTEEKQFKKQFNLWMKRKISYGDLLGSYPDYSSFRTFLRKLKNLLGVWN